MSKIFNLPDAAPRMTVIDGDKLGIKTYGEDNGYPQRMLNLYNASSSAKMCANLCASYIIGKGFEDKMFYKAKINKHGLTPDKLIRVLAPDKAKLRGVAVHINYNALYQKESVSFVPFENCRIGDGDFKGKIGVNKNWYSSKSGGSRRKVEDIDFIDKYNPDPLVIEEQVAKAGGWANYKGQIIWHSDDYGTYPLSTVDPVLNDLQAEIESSNTRKNNLKNNFQLKTIWIEKGQPQDEDQQRETVEEIRKFVGSEGNQVSVTFSEDPDGKDIQELKTLTSSINDKLFQYTDQAARLAIYTAFGQPAILHSDYQGTNGYNEGQLPQSMAYYNSLTEPDRIFFEELFTEIFTNFNEPINPSGSYKITPLETVTDGNLSTEEDKPLIETIGIGGTQALQGILADTVTTPEQKKNILIIVFGLTEENAGKLAGTEAGTIATPEE